MTSEARRKKVKGKRHKPATGLASLALAVLLLGSYGLTAAASLPTPEQFAGFPIGSDSKLVRWDKIVEYMKLAASGSDRVKLRELGSTNGGNALIALEISAPDTLKNLDRYKQLQRKLYLQGGPPAPRERDEIFRRGKMVVLVTCSIHANEIGGTQMALELVHRMATDNSPQTKKILDNVVLLLVPSLNPDGQILVTDWFNKNVGTPYENSPLPTLYHPYAGHDNNRDMYMFTQKESQYMADLVWHDWFPSVWLDEHQMGNNGPRIFVMPASDPINPNVHPLVYRWNGILGQSQAAALEAAGKEGIIYNSTYTNFWEGAMAWSGWWHNRIGLLTEVASARIAAPVDQRRTPAPTQSPSLTEFSTTQPNEGILPPPTDITPRTEYLRPWLGGRWTLRDVVDYELIATLGLLDAAADRRETILRQLYEVNRQTVEGGTPGEPTAIVVPVTGQHDGREAVHLIDRLQIGGVEVYQADSSFDTGERQYAPGTFVIPMTQVFARYAKDMLERQTYPEVRRGAGVTPEQPYDVTAWSLGMLLGVEVDFVRTPLPASLKLRRLAGTPKLSAGTEGNGGQFSFDYRGPDTAIAVNRLLKRGAAVNIDGSSRISVTGVSRSTMDRLAEEIGLSVTAGESSESPVTLRSASMLHAPRVALYAPWTGGNSDEGWTRWVLEQYEFDVTTVHNAEIQAGGLRDKFDALILADQNPRDILEGFSGPAIRPEYRGGIGENGLRQIERFVAAGGTLVTLGAASDLAIDRLAIPAVRDAKRGLRRDQHFVPGAILHVEVDTSHPIGFGMAPSTYGFYNNSPFFTVTDSPRARDATVVARYPKRDVLASGWLKGEDLMAGQAAVVSVEMHPGRVVLFGLRPQHRAQTHATFPMLFNALYLAAADDGSARVSQ